MNREYKKAPNILTGKDLSYLKDIFGWNYSAYKLLNDSMQFVENKEISKLLKECSNLFYENMNDVLNILENGGNNE
ncbi:MAG: hypothetical protein E7161_00385 [Firmicutes bacterium]|nr:hypothetical protein [Bacillota bacterium]